MDPIVIIALVKSRKTTRFVKTYYWQLKVHVNKIIILICLPNIQYLVFYLPKHGCMSSII